MNFSSFRKTLRNGDSLPREQVISIFFSDDLKKLLQILIVMVAFLEISLIHANGKEYLFDFFIRFFFKEDTCIYYGEISALCTVSIVAHLSSVKQTCHLQWNFENMPLVTGSEM